MHTGEHLAESASELEDGMEEKLGLMAMLPLSLWHQRRRNKKKRNQRQRRRRARKLRHLKGLCLLQVLRLQVHHQLYTITSRVPRLRAVPLGSKRQLRSNQMAI